MRFTGETLSKQRPRPSARGLVVFVVRVAVLVCLVACEKSMRDPSAVTPTTPSEVAGQGEQPPAALQSTTSLPAPIDPMAEHSATTIVLTGLSQVSRPTPGKAILELRFDALDANGNPARMAGDLRVVVRAEGAAPEHCAFDVQILTVRQQLKHFDDTLGVYVVRLEPRYTREPAVGAAIEVTATFAARDGNVIETTGRVAW